MQQFDRTPSRLDFSNTASSFVFFAHKKLSTLFPTCQCWYKMPYPHNSLGYKIKFCALFHNETHAPLSSSNMIGYFISILMHSQIKMLVCKSPKARPCFH